MDNYNDNKVRDENIPLSEYLLAKSNSIMKQQAITRNMRIARFLIEINKLMEGVYVEETTENYENFSLIKFEAKLTCQYANPSYWNPTPAFFSIIMNAAKKHFRDDVNNIKDFGWNNTNTIFWIAKDKI